LAAQPVKRQIFPHRLTPYAWILALQSGTVLQQRPPWPLTVKTRRRCRPRRGAC